ncbi:MAG: diguanylate cyclase domain-containing protein [Leptospirales bacterium]
MTGKGLKLFEIGKRQNRWIPVAEGVLGILLVGGAFWSYSGSGILVHPRFHPFEIIVLLVAGRYGFFYGTLTAVFAFLSYYGVLLYRDGLSSFFPVEFSFLWPSVFLFSGMVMGDLRDEEHRKMEDKSRQLEREREQTRNTAIQNSILETALTELEKRFLLQPETVSTLYDVARSINVADIHTLPHALLSGIFRFAKIETASIYKRAGNHWILYESLGRFPRQTEIPLKEGIFGRALSAGKLIILRDLFEHQNHTETTPDPQDPFPPPLMALPIRGARTEIMWMIAVESISFHQLTPETLRMLEIIGDWAGTQLAMIEDQEETRKKIPVDPVTGLFQKDFFLERSREELQKAQRYNLPLSLLEIDFTPKDPLGQLLLGQSYLASLKKILPEITRDTDVKGASKSGKSLWLLLTVTDHAGAQIVGERFRNLYLERNAVNTLEELEIQTRIVTYSSRPESDKAVRFQEFQQRLTALGEKNEN